MIVDVIDIHSRSNCQIAANLSNLASHFVTIDGVLYASMECFLQSLKFKDRKAQKLFGEYEDGYIAKKVGQKGDSWKLSQRLYWQGQELDRHGCEYQALLDRAYESLLKNKGFEKLLVRSGKSILIHSVGKTDPSDTILTEREFCLRLMRLRKRLFL